MKKRIISILLVMVLFCTMTACVGNSNAQSATVEPTTVVITAPVKIEPDLKVLALSQEAIISMAPQEVFAWFDEMVQLSKTETLSYQDMQNIARSFKDIWWYDKHTFERNEYEAKAYEVFINIYNQALERDIPLEDIRYWTWVPVAEIQELYFSSNQFSSTDSIVCDVLGELSEEDATRVAKTFFENPLFDTNCNLPFDAIFQNHYKEIMQMGVERLMTLSKSSNPEIADMAFDHILELAKNADEETFELIKQIVAQLCNTENANQLLNALEK